MISNCNRTEWSPIRSVIRVITKSDDRAAELDDTKSYFQLIIKVMKERENFHGNTDKGDKHSKATAPPT